MSRKAIRAIRKYLPAPTNEWTGTLVERDGSVTVSGNPLYSWVQKRAGGQAIPVYNDGVPALAGQRVLVGSDERDRRERVLRGVYTAGTNQAINPNIGAHAGSHALNGSDPVWLSSSQITNGLAYATTGMNVTVNPGWVQYGGLPVKYLGTTLDLTASIPATGAAYSIIRVSSAGVVSVQDGTPVASVGDLTGADIPTVPEDYAAIAIVRLYDGQAALSRTTTGPDVIDVRFATNTYTAGGGASALDDLTDVNAGSPTDGQVLAWDDGTSKWIAADASTVAAFTDLTDTPANYSGAGSKLVAVNAGATALEFVARTYWEPVTDGDTVAPEIIFDADGYVIMDEVTL